MCSGNPVSSVCAEHAGRYVVRKETTSVLRVKFTHFVQERIIKKKWLCTSQHKNCFVLLMNWHRVRPCDLYCRCTCSATLIKLRVLVKECLCLWYSSSCSYHHWPRQNIFAVRRPSTLDHNIYPHKIKQILALYGVCSQLRCHGCCIGNAMRWTVNR